MLRTQEIIAKTPEIQGREAIKSAIRERFSGNYEQLLDFATTATDSVLKKLAKSTYDLPDHPTLMMDIPQTIVINTDGGPLFIAKSQAELGHVRMWIHDGLQHHSSQKYRFNRLAKELKQLDSMPDQSLWVDVRAQLPAQDGTDAVEAVDEQPAASVADPVSVTDTSAETETGIGINGNAE